MGQGAGPPLISFGATTKEAAPRFAVFEAWVLGNCAPAVFACPRDLSPHWQTSLAIISTNAHPSNIAKGGATSVGVAFSKLKSKGGPAPLSWDGFSKNQGWASPGMFRLSPVFPVPSFSRIS